MAGVKYVLGAAVAGGERGSTRDRLGGWVLLAAVAGVASACAASAATPVGSGCGSVGGFSFYVSCDVTLAGAVHQCTEFYGNLPAGAGGDTTSKALCTAMSGTPGSGRCATADSLGSCASSSTSGQYGMGQITTFYAAQGLTEEKVRAACGKSNTYAAPGETPSIPGANGGAVTCGGGSGPTVGGHFSFSVLTNSNGAPFECTNYFGVSADGIASAIQAGGTTDPCPDNGKVGAVCDVHKGGPLGGDEYVLIYYDGLFADAGAVFSSADCSGMGGTFSTTYTIPAR